MQKFNKVLAACIAASALVLSMSTVAQAATFSAPVLTCVQGQWSAPTGWQVQNAPPCKASDKATPYSIWTVGTTNGGVFLPTLQMSNIYSSSGQPEFNVVYVGHSPSPTTKATFVNPADWSRMGQTNLSFCNRASSLQACSLNYN